MIKHCNEHKLPQIIICIGQYCSNRLGCELCINKHQHKFYLDTKCKQKQLKNIQHNTSKKIKHLTNYTINNIDNLKLQKYRNKLLEHFAQQQVYLTSKIEQQKVNFNILIDRAQKIVKDRLNNFKQMILKIENDYSSQAQVYYDSAKEYEELQNYFQNGDWNNLKHIEYGINFLYSDELLFRYNRNLDRLKKKINHYKKENDRIFYWFKQRRQQYDQIELCPHKIFRKWMQLYQQQPQIIQHNEQKTKQTRDDKVSILASIKQDRNKILIYPQIIYQSFQYVNKIIRCSNTVFATSGSRSINLWTKVSINPEKSYLLDYPSYAIATFKKLKQEQSSIILYGKSNGQIGNINTDDHIVRQINAHQAAVRDILQLDEFHFVTASQDWLLKVWGVQNDEKSKHFASERLTLKGHSGKIYTICKFGPNVLAAGADGTIKLWDIMSCSYDEVFEQQKQIYALEQIRPELFAASGQSKQLRIWDYRKTKTPAIKFSLQNFCYSILQYDSNTIIIADKNIVKLIDIRNFKQPLVRLTNQETYIHSVNSMVYLSDVQIAMGGTDNIITVWKY